MSESKTVAEDVPYLKAQKLVQDEMNRKYLMPTPAAYRVIESLLVQLTESNRQSDEYKRLYDSCAVLVPVESLATATGKQEVNTITPEEVYALARCDIRLDKQEESAIRQVIDKAYKAGIATGNGGEG